MSNNKSQRPTLFIQQQSFVRPPSNLNMQEVYTSREEIAPLEEEQPVQDEMNKTISLAKEAKNNTHLVAKEAKNNTHSVAKE
ncbi:hypothetical protein V7266_13780, partial [Neobacillus drentensis]|uniref:hypothetical protein n=1 Tax=Neobacillus drentensis TaxID=220684 RepID=UPI002FFED7C4